MTWESRAACRDEDPELFFPLGDGRAYDRQVALAKSICAGCPVRVICVVDHAAESHGIFGGHTEKERAKARRAAEKPTDQLDPVALARRANGDTSVTLTCDEKHALARQLLAAGASRTHVGRVTGLNGGTVARLAQGVAA